MRNIFLLTIGILYFFASNHLEAKPPKEAPKKWPCDQVYNPVLDLNAIWQGPDISDFKRTWWKDDNVIEAVNKLSNPILSEEDGIKIIEDFAKKYTFMGLIKKGSQKDKMISLFTGLYEKASQKRSKQYEGIIKFVVRQDVIRKTIGEASKDLRSFRKAGMDKKNVKYVNAESRLKWNTRVFDQRTRLTEYVCEEPVFLEQRIGYQARKIIEYLN